MRELSHNLGKLLDRGWRPDRTIVIAGWDGEEYGLFGSTEDAEQERVDLVRTAVAHANLQGTGGTGRTAGAYANPDGAGGTEFGASGVPQLDDAIVQTTQSVSDPRTGAPV